MATSIDELQIEINAQAVKANQAIDTLVKKIDKLTVSVGSLDTSKLNSLSSSISNISTSMKSLDGIKADGFASVTRNIKALNKIDSSNLAVLSNNVRQISSAFSGMTRTTEAVTNLNALANGIKQLGYKSADKAIGNIPLLAKAMKQLMAELSTAPKVSRNIIDMTNALAKLARTGASSGKAATSISKAFDGIYRSSGKASLGITKLSGKFKSLFRQIMPFIGIWKMFSFAKQAVEISSDLTEVQNVVDVTFGDFKQKIENLASVSIPELGMSELTTKQIASRFQAMGTAMGIAQGNMADMSVELTRLTGDMASFYNVEQKAVGEDLEAIFTGQTKPLRQYGLDLTEATLQEWALKQGIDANVNSMSQMEKTMLRYQYVLANTKAAQGDFLRTQDTWANQIRILKEQIKQLASIIGGVFINALKPLVKALNAAMSKIIAFAKVISDALGKIFGWTYEVGGGTTMSDDFEIAADSSDDIAKSTGKAAKNIKDMKAGLRAFDELKTINLPDATGADGAGAGGLGGIGGGGGAGSQVGMWKESERLPFESDIDTLYKLGKEISRALISTMESIDWDNVYEKARGFGKGLASFLNGLFAGQNGKTLFGEVGRTIASALNTAIYAALSFAEEFDFKQFGYNIADGINNFFRTFDFKSLAKTLNKWVDGIIDTIKTVISEIDWKEVFKGLGDFFGNLDLDTVIFFAFLTAPKLKKAFGKAIEGLGALKLTLPTIELGVAEGGISAISASTVALTGALAALATGLIYVFATNENVRKGFLDSVNAIKEGLQPSIQFFTDTILPNLKSGFEAVLEILKPIGDFLSGAFTSIWTEIINPTLERVGTTILPSLSDAFQSLWNNVLVPFGKFLAAVLKPAFEVIADVMTVLWNNVVIPLAGAFADILLPALDLVIQSFASGAESLKPIIETLTFLWKNVVVPIASYLWDTFKPIFEDTFEIIGGIIDGFGKVLGGLITFITGTFSGDWQKAWEGIKEVFRGIFNALAPIVETVVNGIIKGINKFISGFNLISGAVGDMTGITISIPEIQQISIPRYQAGGFPEDGLFYANHTELVGQFSNGKTAVANNEQIIEGIREGVRSAVSDVLAPYLREIATNTRETADKEFGITENAIGKAASNYASDYYRRTGKYAYQH